MVQREAVGYCSVSQDHPGNLVVHLPKWQGWDISATCYSTQNNSVKVRPIRGSESNFIPPLVLSVRNLMPGNSKIRI